jgi:hypothetical protein
MLSGITATVPAVSKDQQLPSRSKALNPNSPAVLPAALATRGAAGLGHCRANRCNAFQGWVGWGWVGVELGAQVTAARGMCARGESHNWHQSSPPDIKKRAKTARVTIRRRPMFVSPGTALERGGELKEFMEGRRGFVLRGGGKLRQRG